MSLHPVRDKQARQTQGQFAHAFLQRNGQCRIGWQSEQCAQEDKAALECTQRSRQHERCDTNAGTKAFEDKRIDHAEGSGCPKACITNQTSPASAAQAIDGGGICVIGKQDSGLIVAEIGDEELAVGARRGHAFCSKTRGLRYLRCGMSRVMGREADGGCRTQ